MERRYWPHRQPQDGYGHQCTPRVTSHMLTIRPVCAARPTARALARCRAVARFRTICTQVAACIAETATGTSRSLRHHSVRRGVLSRRAVQLRGNRERLPVVRTRSIDTSALKTVCLVRSHLSRRWSWVPAGWQKMVPNVRAKAAKDARRCRRAGVSFLLLRFTRIVEEIDH